MSERKPDRVGQVFAALGKSVCYVTLFLGMQVAVMLPLFVSVISEMVVGESAVDEGTNDAPTLLTAVSLAPALYFLVTTGLALLPEKWIDSYIDASSGIDSGTFFGVVAVVFVAPVVEEFIFRGLVMNRLSRVMPGWLAVVLSAAAFGACHGHPVWFAYAFVLGAVFGFIDLRAGSIWPSILGHVAFNAIGQIFTFIPETEEGTEVVIAMGVLLVVGIILPVLNRKAIAALFRPAPAPLAAQEQPTKPKNYDYDPWDM